MEAHLNAPSVPAGSGTRHKGGCGDGLCHYHGPGNDRVVRVQDAGALATGGGGWGPRESESTNKNGGGGWGGIIRTGPFQTRSQAPGTMAWEQSLSQSLKKLLETTVCKASATIPCITRACRAVSCASSMPITPTVLLALGTLVPAVAGAHLAAAAGKHTHGNDAARRCKHAMWLHRSDSDGSSGQKGTARGRCRAGSETHTPGPVPSSNQESANLLNKSTAPLRVPPRDPGTGRGMSSFLCKRGWHSDGPSTPACTGRCGTAGS